MQRPAVAPAGTVYGSRLGHRGVPAGRSANVRPNTRSAAQLRSPAVTLACFVLLIVFLIAFPKGGIKMGAVPITIGYVLLGAIGGLSVFRLMLNLNNLPTASFFAWTLTLPFQVVLIVTYFGYGVIAGSLAILLASFTSFIFMPNAFLLLFPISYRRLNQETVRKTLVYAIRFICLFGVLLFLLKTFLNFNLEIPFLTVNLDEVDVIDSKNNTRGAIFKMISTYNNGNIFGVCLGMLLPLYFYIEKRKLFFMLAVACMILTLSRTAWVSLVVALAMIAWVDFQRPSRIVAILFVGLIFIALLPILLQLMGRGSDFLLDSDLGGRDDQLDAFHEFAFMPSQPVGIIREITYASIYRIYGLVGLLTFMVYLLAPIIVTLMGNRRSRFFNRAAVGGLIVYIVTACSDGATILIPVMAIYFLIGLLAVEGTLDLESEPRRPLLRRRANRSPSPPYLRGARPYG